MSKWHLRPCIVSTAAWRRPSLQSQVPTAGATQRYPWTSMPQSHSSQPGRRRRPGRARSHRRPRSLSLSSPQPSQQLSSQLSSSHLPSRYVNNDSTPEQWAPEAANRAQPALDMGSLRHDAVLNIQVEAGAAPAGAAAAGSVQGASSAGTPVAAGALPSVSQQQLEQPAGQAAQQPLPAQQPIVPATQQSAAGQQPPQAVCLQAARPEPGASVEPITCHHPCLADAGTT